MKSASTQKLRLVNIEYSAMQAFYWASFCSIISFAAVYLQARGYSNTTLGQVLAVGYVLGFLLPQVLAGWIDRSKKITVYHCQWALFLFQVFLVLILRQLPGNGLSVSVLCCLMIGIEIAINPLNTEISAELDLSLGHINYGVARGMGSLAFAPVAVLIGRLLEDRGMQVLPWINLLCIALQALALLSLCLTIRGAEAVSGNRITRSQQASSFVDFFLENRRFFGLLAGAVLLFFTHNLINNYLINIVRNVGGDTSDMGTISGFTAAMEIPMMLFYDRLLRRFSCAFTVRFSSVMFAAKALAITCAVSIRGLLAANILQIVSFAMITPAMVRYVILTIDPKDSAKGQALSYGTVTLGSIFASLFGGMLYDTFTVRETLLVGVASAALGAVLCNIFARPDKTAPVNP